MSSTHHQDNYNARFETELPVTDNDITDYVRYVLSSVPEDGSDIYIEIWDRRPDLINSTFISRVRAEAQRQRPNRMITVSGMSSEPGQHATQ